MSSLSEEFENKETRLDEKSNYSNLLFKYGMSATFENTMDITRVLRSRKMPLINTMLNTHSNAIMWYFGETDKPSSLTTNQLLDHFIATLSSRAIRAITRMWKNSLLKNFINRLKVDEGVQMLNRVFNSNSHCTGNFIIEYIEHITDKNIIEQALSKVEKILEKNPISESIKAINLRKKALLSAKIENKDVRFSVQTRGRKRKFEDQDDLSRHKKSRTEESTSPNLSLAANETSSTKFTQNQAGNNEQIVITNLQDHQDLLPFLFFANEMTKIANRNHKEPDDKKDHPINFNFSC